MSAVAQILSQVREFVAEALSGRDDRLDKLEARIAAVEERLSSPPTVAKARTATARGGAHNA